MPFEWSDDINQAAWWVDALHPFAQDVGSVVPDTFEAYARVFHPVLDEDHTRRTWAELAAVNRRIAHPEMQLHEIGRPPGTPRPPRYDPNEWANRAARGRLPSEELVALRDVLTPYTATAECWCCVWEGYGQLHGHPAAGMLTSTSGGSHATPLQVPPMAPREVLDGPRVAVPGRGYYLLRGLLAEVPDLFEFLGGHSPNIWWPDDQAWCVATEIDFAWTYVGGSTDAIEAVLADPRLEVLASRPTDRFTHDSDLLNPALDAE